MMFNSNMENLNSYLSPIKVKAEYWRKNTNPLGVNVVIGIVTKLTDKAGSYPVNCPALAQTLGSLIKVVIIRLSYITTVIYRLVNNFQTNSAY